MIALRLTNIMPLEKPASAADRSAVKYRKGSLPQWFCYEAGSAHIGTPSHSCRKVAITHDGKDSIAQIIHVLHLEEKSERSRHYVWLVHSNLTFFDPHHANNNSRDRKKLAPPIPENVMAGFKFTCGFARVEFLAVLAFRPFSKSTTEYVIKTKPTRAAMIARTRMAIRERETICRRETRCEAALYSKAFISSSST